MEFFDDVINKTRDAIDVAYKKTNEVVSIQRQKFDIAAMESKLAKDYQNLGRVCFDIINDEKERDAVQSRPDSHDLASGIPECSGNGMGSLFLY